MSTSSLTIPALLILLLVIIAIIAIPIIVLIVVITNDKKKNAETVQQYSYGDGSRTPDIPSAGMTVLGFFFPLVGLILYLVFKDEMPLKAKSAGKGALIGVITGAVVSVLIIILYVVFIGVMINYMH